MQDTNGSWVISRNTILMSKAPLSWISSCATEKKNTLENITGIIDGIITYVTERKDDNSLPKLNLDSSCNIPENFNIPPLYANNYEHNCVSPVPTPEERPNTPVNCDQTSVTSNNSFPVHSPLSSTLTMSPGKTNSPSYL